MSNDKDQESEPEMGPAPDCLEYYIESPEEGVPFNLPPGKLRIGELLDLVAGALPDVVGDRPQIQSDIANCSLAGGVFIGEGTVLDPYVSIEGPVWIGRNCHIGHGALLRPGTILGDGCVVGHGAEVKNSFAFPGAKLQSVSFVGDSILGNGARVGSGSILANRRFDQGPIPFSAGEGKIDSARGFLGALVGDFTRIGANSVLLPGSAIGPYCWLMPGTVIGGWIPRAKRVTQRASTQVDDNIEKRLG